MMAGKAARESNVLDRVTVRLVAENEVGQFNYYLQEEHYLESSRLAGQSLRYVAEVDGQWVALLTFSAAALHLKARERWIGWGPAAARPAAGLGRQQQSFSGAAGTPPVSQPRLESPGDGAAPAQRRLAGALGPSGAGRREFRR